MPTDEIIDEIKAIISECVDYLYELDFSPPGLLYENQLPSNELIGKLSKKYKIDRFNAGRLFNPVYQIFLKNFAWRDPYPYNPFPYIENIEGTHVHYWRLKYLLPDKKGDFIEMVLAEWTPYLEANLELARNGNNPKRSDMKSCIER